MLEKPSDEPGNEPGAVARACYRAYADKDRDAIEALIAPDFHFTSPLDNRLDRDTYFRRCWPNSVTLARFDFVDVVVHGEHVFVVYEAETSGGKRFRNAERLRVRDGRIVEAEVYFGWNVPHAAPEGGFVEPRG